MKSKSRKPTPEQIENLRAVFILAGIPFYPEALRDSEKARDELVGFIHGVRARALFENKRNADLVHAADTALENLGVYV